MSVHVLLQELELYNKDLLNKPAMLLVNKMDSEGAQQKYREIKSYFSNLPGIRHKSKQCTT